MPRQQKGGNEEEGVGQHEAARSLLLSFAMPIAHALLQAHLQRQHPSTGQRDPYHCLCCTHPSQKFTMIMYQQWGGVIIHMPPLPPY
jgi:hypothetical protein